MAVQSGSYSSAIHGPRALARQAVNLVRGHTRDVGGTVATHVARLGEIERVVREHTGLELSGLDVLDVGTGQRLIQLAYFSRRNRVTGIDRDVIVQGFEPLGYSRMLRTNGALRVAKTIARKAPPHRRPVPRRSRATGWTRALPPPPPGPHDGRRGDAVRGLVLRLRLLADSAATPRAARAGTRRDRPRHASGGRRVRRPDAVHGAHGLLGHQSDRRRRRRATGLVRTSVPEHRPPDRSERTRERPRTCRLATALRTCDAGPPCTRTPTGRRQIDRNARRASSGPEASCANSTSTSCLPASSRWSARKPANDAGGAGRSSSVTVTKRTPFGPSSSSASASPPSVTGRSPAPSWSSTIAPGTAPRTMFRATCAWSSPRVSRESTDQRMVIIPKLGCELRDAEAILAERRTDQPRTRPDRPLDGVVRPHELLADVGAAERRRVWMSEGMVPELVTLGDDSLEDGLVAADLLANDEERRACVVPAQEVEDPGRVVRGRSVVKGQGHPPRVSSLDDVETAGRGVGGVDGTRDHVARSRQVGHRGGRSRRAAAVALAALCALSFTASSSGDRPVKQAAVVVSPRGNDSTCARNSPARTCASWGRAYRVALPGDLIEIQPGTYGNQTLVHDPAKRSSLSVTFRGSGSVVLQGVRTRRRHGLQQRRRPLERRLRAIRGPRPRPSDVDDWGDDPTDQPGLKHARSVPQRHRAAAPDALRTRPRDALERRARTFLLQLLGDRARYGAGQPEPVEDITLDRVYVHDITDNCSYYPEPGCNGLPAPNLDLFHVDCLQAYGGDRITIRRSRFFNCATQAIFAGTEGGGTFSNWTIENTMVGGIRRGATARSRTTRSSSGTRRAARISSDRFGSRTTR